MQVEIPSKHIQSGKSEVKKQSIYAKHVESYCQAETLYPLSLSFFFSVALPLHLYRGCTPKNNHTYSKTHSVPYNFDNMVLSYLKKKSMSVKCAKMNKNKQETRQADHSALSHGCNSFSGISLHSLSVLIVLLTQGQNKIQKPNK